VTRSPASWSTARATAGGSGRQRHQGAVAAFAVNEHDPVAVFHAQVADVDGAGLGDPEPEEAEQQDQYLCGRPGFARRGEQGLELQMCQPERG
jgi:hypothetical protein